MDIRLTILVKVTRKNDVWCDLVTRLIATFKRWRATRASLDSQESSILCGFG